MLMLHSDTVANDDGKPVDMKVKKEGLVLHHLLSRVPSVLTQHIYSRQEEVVANVCDSAKFDQVLLRILRHAAANIVLVGIVVHPASIAGLADGASHITSTSTVDSLLTRDAAVVATASTASSAAASAAATAAAASIMSVVLSPIRIHVPWHADCHHTICFEEAGAAVGIEALSVVATAR
eukprot:1060360-Pleurochrysis_carterae.AAC.1